MADTFFDDDNKPVQECGAASVILEHAGFEVIDLKPVADDPPDCAGVEDEAIDKAGRVAHQAAGCDGAQPLADAV